MNKSKLKRIIISVIIGVSVLTLGGIYVYRQNKTIKIQNATISRIQDEIIIKNDQITQAQQKVDEINKILTKTNEENQEQKQTINNLENTNKTLEEEKNKALTEISKSKERLEYLEKRKNELTEEVKKKKLSKSVDKPLKIAVDIGHNAEYDTGSVSEYGKEDVFCKAVGEELMFLLQKEGYTVKGVHPQAPTSTNNSLRQRVGKANEDDVDLFVSVHFNKVDTDKANGTEIFINDKGKIEDLANVVLKKFENYGFTNRGVKKANLFVVKNSESPAMLVECAFISNLSDMSKYDPYKFAENILDGIKQIYPNKS